MLRSFTKRRPGRGYLWKAGVLLGNFGSCHCCSYDNNGNAMPVPTWLLLPSKEQDFRSQSGSTALPISAKRTLCAIFDAHKRHQDPDGASAVTRRTGEVCFFSFTLFSCFMAEESRAYKSYRINLSRAGMCTSLPDRSISACAD